MSESQRILDKIDQMVEKYENGDETERLHAEDLGRIKQTFYLQNQNNLMSATTLDTDQIEKIRHVDIGNVERQLYSTKQQIHDHNKRKDRKFMSNIKIVFIIMIVMFVIYLFYNSKLYQNKVKIPDVKNIDKLSSMSHHNSQLGIHVPFNFPGTLQ